MPRMLTASGGLRIFSFAMKRHVPLAVSAVSLFVLFSAVGCGGLVVNLPTTPRMQALTEEQVFATAPPPDWGAPQADVAATAPVDIACGVGPRTSTGLLYAAVSVRGRSGSGNVGPLNLSLVLDRSGSMAGEPFRNMLLAAETFVNQMRDGDRLSVVAFSDGVYEVAPPVVVDPGSRGAVIAGIRGLQDGGGTFFSGGMLAGLAEVFSGYQPWAVNQVILFSDGQPNIGITSSSELSRIAERAAQSGVSVTTIGFGRDHDELLMQSIADASGGNYYYVDSPADMPAIFQREAGAVLRTAARATDVEVQLPPSVVREDVIGYDYFVTGPGHVFVRVGSIPHDEERYVVFKMHLSGGGALPFGIVYADLVRHGRFGVGCRPAFDATRGGRDLWALELAGRAEAAWGMQEAMAWADSGSEVFVISQLGTTRGIIATLRENLGPQALAAEDQMLLGAQAELGFNVAKGAADSLLGGGVGGLLNFGKRQAVSNATTAVAYNVDKTFQSRVRVGIAFSFHGAQGMRYVAHGTPYKQREQDGSIRFKRVRWKTYEMMRVRKR
jgi:von Willebrand factor type A domain